MGEGMNPVILKFDVDDKGSVKVKKIDRNLSAMNRGMERAERISRGLDKAGSRVNRILGNIAKTAMLAAVSLATLAGAAATVHFKKSVESYIEYESKMADLVKVTDESVGKISKRILSIDPLLGRPAELASAYYQTLSAGVTEQKAAMDTMTTAAETAKAAHTDQATVIDGLTKMMGGFAHENMTAARAADLLFAIEAKGITTVQKMIPYMGSLSAASKMLGVSSTEMAASFATITKLSGDTSEAATRYIAMTTALQRSQGALGEAIKDMGYESGQATEAIADRGLSGTLEGLFDLVDQGKYRINDLFVEIRAMQGAAFLANRDFEVLSQTMEEMGDIADLQEKAFAAWADTTAAKTEKVKNRISRLRVMIGENLDPSVKRFLDTMDDWLVKNERLIIQLSDWEYMSAMARSVFENIKHDFTKVSIYLTHDVKATFNEFAGIVVGAIESLKTDLDTAGSIVGVFVAKIVIDIARLNVGIINAVLIGLDKIQEVAIVAARAIDAAMAIAINQVEIQIKGTRNLVAGIVSEIKETLETIPGMGSLAGMIPEMQKVDVPALIGFKEAYDNSALGNSMEGAKYDFSKHKLGMPDAYTNEEAAARIVELLEQRKKAMADLDATQKAYYANKVEGLREAGDQAMAYEMAQHEKKIALLDAEIQKRQEFLDKRRELAEQEQALDTDRLANQSENAGTAVATEKEKYSLISESMTTAQTVAEATGKKGAKIAKALSAASTLFSSYQAAQATYTRIVEAPGAGPGAVATATVAAAMTLAQGLARVAMINSAATYHTGGMVTPLGPREVPIIAEVGEVILNRQQVAAMSSGGGTKQQPVNVALFDDRQEMDEWAQSREGKVLIMQASRQVGATA